MEKRVKFVIGDHGSICSERAIILPICVGNQFRPVRARLIGGDAEIPLRMGIIEKRYITVDFGMRDFHIWEGRVGSDDSRRAK